MLVSRPDCEKRQTSKFAAADEGRVRTIGLPPREQVLVLAEKFPSAAMSSSTSAPGTETPAVVGSTTAMSLLVAAGAAPVRAMAASLVFGATTTMETVFEREPSGFWICTVRLAGIATSDGKTAPVHRVADRQ